MKINAIEPQNAFTCAIDDFSLKSDQEIRDEIISSSQNTYGVVIKTPETAQQNAPQVDQLTIDGNSAQRRKLI